jgi:hypothetical protein
MTAQMLKRANEVRPERHTLQDWKTHLYLFTHVTVQARTVMVVWDNGGRFGEYQQAASHRSQDSFSTVELLDYFYPKTCLRSSIDYAKNFVA